MHNLVAIGISTGRGGAWYEYLFLILAILLVFPEKVMEYLVDRGWIIDWRHYIWLESILLVVMTAVTILLLPYYPRLHWFLPVIETGLVGLFRLIRWFLIGIFFPDEE